MSRVGKSIWAVYHFIPSSEKCYMVMDRAGYHGTNDVIERYLSMLSEKYDIETIF